MLTPDQIIAGLLFILGIGAAIAALFQPLVGLVVTVIGYLVKLWNRGPFPNLNPDTKRRK